MSLPTIRSTLQNRGLIRIFFLAAAAAVLAGGGCNLFNPTVYLGVKAGEHHAAAVDTAGTVHLAYTYEPIIEEGEAVRYIYYRSGSPAAGWSGDEVVFQSEPDYSGPDPRVEAITAAADGTVHLVYLNANERIAYHAYKNGGKWTTEVLYQDEAGPVGDLAIDNEGGIHVSHSKYRTNTLLSDNLRPLYSYKPVGGLWQTTEISLTGWADVNYGRESSLTLDNSGNVHLLFGCEGNPLTLTVPKVYYVFVEAGQSTPGEAEILSGSATGMVYNTIFADSDGYLHAAWIGYKSDAARLKYLTSRDGGVTWLPETKIGGISGVSDTLAGQVVVDIADSGYSVDGTILADGSPGLAHLYRTTDEQAGTTSFTLHTAARTGDVEDWNLQDSGISIQTTRVADITYLAADSNNYVLHTRVPADVDDPYGNYYLELVVSYSNSSGEWTSELVRAATLPEE